MNGNGNSYEFAGQNDCHLGILVHNTYQIGFMKGVLSKSDRRFQVKSEN